MITAIHNSLRSKREQLAKDDKGFTLIELLVVVLIIGILAAIAIPVFLGQQDSAKDSAVKSDLANAKVAIVAYFTDNPNSSTPTFDNASGTGLKKYGFVASTDTSLVTFSGTAPTKSGDTFCVTAKSDSSAGPTFNITDSTGALKGSTCGVNTP